MEFFQPQPQLSPSSAELALFLAVPPTHPTLQTILFGIIYCSLCSRNPTKFIWFVTLSWRWVGGQGRTTLSLVGSVGGGLRKEGQCHSIWRFFLMASLKLDSHLQRVILPSRDLCTNWYLKTDATLPSKSIYNTNERRMTRTMATCSMWTLRKLVPKTRFYLWEPIAKFWHERLFR